MAILDQPAPSDVEDLAHARRVLAGVVAGGELVADAERRAQAAVLLHIEQLLEKVEPLLDRYLNNPAAARRSAIADKIRGGPRG